MLRAPNRNQTPRLPSIEPTTRLVGLDASMAATGWAVGCPDGTLPVSGVFPRIMGSSRQQIGTFYDRLAALHERYHFEVCFHEHSQVIKGQFSHITDVSEGNRFALKAAIEIAGHLLGFRTHTVEPASWRKSFIGVAHKPAFIKTNGRDWLKEAAIIECKRRGWMVSGHDEAEARGIMDFGLCECNDAYAAMMAGPLTRYGSRSTTA